jgi:hypothetical protein
MLLNDVAAVRYEHHEESRDILCVQTAEVFNIIACGTHGIHRVSRFNLISPNVSDCLLLNLKSEQFQL